MADYKLDKTAFKIMTFKEVDEANIFDKSVPYAERLRQEYILSLQAYEYSLENEPRLDRTCFSCRKHDNR